MKTLQHFFGYSLALLIIIFGLSCSQGSSQLSAEKQRASIAQVNGAEEATGIPDLQKPPGELGAHLTVTATPFQFSDGNLLLNLKGNIQGHSNAPLMLGRWAQITGPAATILRPNNPQTLVLLPEVSEPTELVFRLYGVDDNHFTNAATARVLVMPPVELADARVISAAVNENAEAIDFTIALTKPASVPISISYRTIDRTALAQEDYLPDQGILTFAPGVTEQVVTIAIVDDGESDDGEYFELAINGRIPDGEGEKPFSSSGLGVIKDDEPSPSFPTTSPLDLGPSAADQGVLPGTSGVVRVNLQWDEAADNLNLLVQDPCGQTLFVDTPNIDCLGALGYLDPVEAGAVFENASWPEYAAPGSYVVSVEHFAGLAADYDVRVFYGDQSQHITGTVANGDRVEVFRFDYQGGERSSSSNGSSSTDPSTSSSESSSSESSSSESSSSESSSSESSSSESSSSESSSSESSSSESSSSESSSSESSSSESSSSESSSSESSSSESSSSESSSSESSSSESSSSESSSSESSSSESSSSESSSSESSSSESSSSSEESSSSAVSIEPFVELDLGNQPDILGNVLPLRGTVTADPLVPLVEFYGTLSRDGEPVGNLPLPLALLTEDGSFSAELDLSQGDWLLDDGNYGLSLTIVDRLGRVAQSTTQRFDLRARVAVDVVIESPVAGQYFAPPAITGSIAASPGADLAAQITLRRFADASVSETDIPLSADNRFSYALDQPGRYELTATASDGFSDDTEAVEFVFVDPSVALSAEPQHPMNDSGQYDVTGDLSLLVRLNGDDALPKEGFDIQQQDDDGVWRNLASFDYPQVWDATSASATLTLDFGNAELDLGLYNLRVQLRYGAGLTEATTPFEVNYRAYIPAQITILEPAQESVHYQPFSILVAVSGDPTGQFTVTGSWLSQDTAVEQTVTFSPVGDDTYQFDITQPGNYDMSIAVDDLNTNAVDDSTRLFTAYVDPQVEVQLQHAHPLRADGSVDLFAPLNLLAAVTSNTNRAPIAFELLAGVADAEQLLQNYDAGQVWDAQTNTANVVYDFSNQPYGDYELSLRVILAGDEGISGTSELLPITWRSLAPLTIAIDQPADGSSLANPVAISGSASGDPALGINLAARLTDLDSQAEPVDVVLERDGNEFFYNQDRQGRYRFEVSADNGQQTASASIDFAYQIADLSVIVTHDHPLLADASLDIIGPVALRASIGNPEEYPLQQLVVEMLIDGNWTALQSVAAAADQTQQDFTMDLRAEQLAYGRYPLRVRVDYLNDQTSFSPTLTLEYRQVQDPVFTAIDAPQQGINIGQSLLIAGGYALDPLAAIGVVEASFTINGDPAFGPLAIPAGNDRFSGEVTNSQLSQVNGVSLQIIDSLGNSSQPVDIPIVFVDQTQLFVDIVAPQSEVFSTIVPKLDLLVNFFPLPGTVDLTLRLRSPSGEELLRDTVEGNGLWSIADGQVSGSFDFGQLLPLADGDYTLEVSATYGNGPTLRDQITLAYAEPDLPLVTIDQPQGNGTSYSFAVDISGSVQVDNRLGADGVTDLFTVVERLTPTPVAVADQLPLAYANGRFSGILSESLLNQNGVYRLSVYANDTLGRRSEPAVVEFSYQVPVDLDIRINTPTLPGGATRVDLFEPQIAIGGQVQIQEGAPLTSLSLQLMQAGQNLGSSTDILSSLAGNSQFNYAFNFAQFNLNQGDYDLLISAVDSRGRTDVESLPVTYRPLQQPTLTLRAEPKGDDSRLGGPYSVFYSVDPRANEVILSGRIDHADGTSDTLPIPTPTVTNGQGSVSFSVADSLVQLGVNTLTLTLSDGQNQVSTSVQISFQRPVVIIDSPQNGATVTGDRLNLIFSVDFDGPEPNSQVLANTVLFHNNQLLLANAQPQRLQDGRWQLAVDISDFDEGEHGVGLEVGDYRRPNVTNDRVNDPLGRVLFDVPPRITPPQVTIVSPTDNFEIPPIGNTTFNIKFSYQFSDGASLDRPNYAIYINGGEPITNVPTATANGPNTYEVSLPTVLLNKGRNSVEVRVADYRDANIIGSSPAISILVPDIFPPLVSITTPRQNEVLSYAGFNLIFYTEYDNPDNQVPLHPNCELRINRQEFDCGFGIPRDDGGFAVVLANADAVFRVGSNTIELTVHDYRDANISTTVIREFTYTPAVITVTLANANGAILPLSGGDVRVNFTSSVPLSYAFIKLNDTTVGSTTLTTTGSQAPYSYSYTIPRSAITPGWSDVQVDGWVPANGGDSFSASKTARMSYRDPSATITTTTLLGGGRLAVRVSDPGGSTNGGTIVIFYNNQQIGLQKLNAGVPGTNVQISMPVSSAGLPAGNVSLVVVYRDSQTDKELFRGSKTVAFIP